MIISRTPFRVSFFGGGTDYPSWYLKHGGQVLSTTINKYCYINCRVLPPFFEHRIRVVYSKIENCQSFEEIKHPAAREVIRYLGLQDGLEIHHDGDLPARSGMGSSSAFTVGLLNALYGLQGKMAGRHQLAVESIHIEQDMIGECVGSQDQVAAAYGGLNRITFCPSGEIVVKPVILPPRRKAALNAHLMLFYTGIMRNASRIAETYANTLPAQQERLEKMSGMVDDGVRILTDDACPLDEFGSLLHEGWSLKRNLSAEVSNDSLDQFYRRARAAGAVGGKIIGAGGGGFLLLFAPPDAHEKILAELGELLFVPFAFEDSGSQVIFYEPERENYREIESRRNRAGLAPFREHEKLKNPS